MAYTKTAWVDGSAPAISAGNLNKIESGIENSIGLDTLADLRTQAVPTIIFTASVLGHTAAGDGGGGLFWWDSASTETDNDGTIITPGSSPASGRWKRLFSEAAHVAWFGAAADGANDAAAINKAIAAHEHVEFTAGAVYVTGTTRIEVPSNRILYGNGATIRPSTGMNISPVNAGNVANSVNIRIYDLYVDSVNCAEGAAGVAGIAVSDTTGFRLVGCRSLNAKNDAFRVGNSKDGEVQGCYAAGSPTTYTSLKIAASENVRVYGNDFRDNNTSVQFDTSAKDCEVFGNYIKPNSSTGFGILVTGNSLDIDIGPNTYRGAQTCVKIDAGSTGCAIAGGVGKSVTSGVILNGDTNSVTSMKLQGTGTSTGTGIGIIGTQNSVIGNRILSFLNGISLSNSASITAQVAQNLLQSNGTDIALNNGTNTIFGMVDDNVSSNGGDFGRTSTVINTTRRHFGVNKIEYASAMPTSGDWTKGDIVWNTNPSVLGTGGSQYIIEGWKRLTSGTNHVLNTDWLEMRTLTGT